MSFFFFPPCWPWAHPGLRKRLFIGSYSDIIFQNALQSWDHGRDQDGNLLVTVGEKMWISPYVGLSWGYSCEWQMLSSWTRPCWLHSRISLKREREREREKHDVREKPQLVAFHMHPRRGLSLQPRYVPWLGIKPAAFWCTGWCSNQLSYLARSNYILFRRHK